MMMEEGRGSPHGSIPTWGQPHFSSGVHLMEFLMALFTGKANASRNCCLSCVRAAFLSARSVSSGGRGRKLAEETQRACGSDAAAGEGGCSAGSTAAVLALFFPGSFCRKQCTCSTVQWTGGCWSQSHANKKGMSSLYESIGEVIPQPSNDKKLNIYFST